MNGWNSKTGMAEDGSVNCRVFTAAVVQFDIVNGDVASNVRTVLKEIGRLKESRVSLVVLPEMFSCGFDNTNLARHAQASEEILDTLCRTARENRVAIAGSLPEAGDNGIYNTMHFIDTDGILKGSYRKIHLFRLTMEHRLFQAGDEVVVADTSLGKIGLATCYDLRFPDLFRALMAKGAQMVVLGAQWPEKRIGHWRVLVQARAVENQFYMICANRTGRDQDLLFTGGSMIVDPNGRICADPGSTDGAARAEVDYSVVDEARRTLGFITDRRPEVYGG